MHRRALVKGAVIGATGTGAAAMVALAGTNAGAAEKPAAAVGGVALDSFPGATDDVKFAAALSHIGAQTFRPALLLANRRHELRNTYPLVNDLSIYGVGMEREFGRQTVVRAYAPALFRVPAGQRDNLVKNITIRGIAFEGSKATDFMEPVDHGSGPILAYSDIRECGFNLFRRVMWNRLLGVSLDDLYINNGYDTQLYLAGSDSYIGSGGHFFMDSPNLPADRYVLRFGHMSKTYVGPLYVTGRKATGIRIDGGQGLTLNGVKSEAPGGGPDVATSGSAVLITGGSGIVLRDGWFFNVMAAPANTGNAASHKGFVTVTGGDGVLITGCRFAGGAAQRTSTPPGTPCVYVAGGRVTANANLAIGGQELIYRQRSAGLLAADTKVTLG